MVYLKLKITYNPVYNYLNNSIQHSLKKNVSNNREKPRSRGIMGFCNPYHAHNTYSTYILARLVKNKKKTYLKNIIECNLSIYFYIFQFKVLTVISLDLCFFLLTLQHQCSLITDKVLILFLRPMSFWWKLFLNFSDNRNIFPRWFLSLLASLTQTFTSNNTLNITASPLVFLLHFPF